MTESPIKKPRSMPRKIVMGCGGLLLAMAVFAGIILVVVGWATSGVADAGNDFLTALNEGDYTTAYNQLNPSLRDQFVSPEALANSVAQGGVEPETWTFSSRSVENSLGELAGSITYSDGHDGRVALKLEYVGEQWLIYDLALNR